LTSLLEKPEITPAGWIGEELILKDEGKQATELCLLLPQGRLGCFNFLG